jgi:hypothetical protein
VRCVTKQKIPPKHTISRDRFVLGKTKCGHVVQYEIIEFTCKCIQINARKIMSITMLDCAFLFVLTTISGHSQFIILYENH